jgi:hypothetical protein
MQRQPGHFGGPSIESDLLIPSTESTMTATSTISVEIDDLPQCEVFDARKEHKATVFFLHVRTYCPRVSIVSQVQLFFHQGLGDTARNLGCLVSYTWDHPLLDHVKLVMPTAYETKDSYSLSP